MDTKDWIVSVCAIVTAVTNLIVAIHKLASKKKTVWRVKPQKIKRKR